MLSNAIKALRKAKRVTGDWEAVTTLNFKVTDADTPITVSVNLRNLGNARQDMIKQSLGLDSALVLYAGLLRNPNNVPDALTVRHKAEYRVNGTRGYFRILPVLDTRLPEFRGVRGEKIILSWETNSV